MNREHRVCPICGSNNKQFLYRNNMAELDGIDLSYSIVACRQCNSVFADNLASREEYKKYYSMYSKYDVSSSPSHETCTIHNKLVELVSKSYKKPIHGVCDIGCGSGNLLEIFGQEFNNIQLIGIDPSPASAIKRLKYFSNARILRGFIENISYTHGCNVFCLTAVLEHLADPFTNLLALHKIMTDGDCLAIEVPDIAAFNGRIGEPFGEFSLEHINYFSINSLKKLLLRVGFDVIAFETVHNQGNGSLLLLAQKNNFLVEQSIQINDNIIINKYIKDSEQHLIKTVDIILPTITIKKFYIFGAGSHTAKLLCRHNLLKDLCIGIIDNNKNLHNKKMGNIKICLPSQSTLPKNSTILISSFKSELVLAEEATMLYPFAKIQRLYS